MKYSDLSFIIRPDRASILKTKMDYDLLFGMK